MDFFKVKIFLPVFLALHSFVFCQDTGQQQNLPRQVVFAMQSGNTTKAIELYKSYRKELGHHDLELVQRLGLILIDQGWRSSDPEVQVLTIFGAGISTNEKTLYILEGGLRNSNPQIQLISLNLLAKYQNDLADDALNKSLAANYLLIRIEALSHLAEKKHPKANGQIEALMSKVDEQLLPIFPPLYAMVGDAAATRNLKRLLSHSSQKVRLSAILSAAKFGRDDLLPQIRILASHPENPQQEACAVALGMMHDEKSVPRLEAMSRSNSINVRLAALQALYRLGRKETRSQIEGLAKEQNCFAICALGEMPGSEPVLRTLAASDQLQIRVNACLALLQRQDPNCLKGLKEILILDMRDLCFQKANSIGGGLTAWKAIPSGRQNFNEDTVSYELSLSMRETVLEQALDLPEKDFLQIAQALFEHHQNDLIPKLCELMENLQSQDTIALLKKYQQKAGAPLIRNYCNLALYSMKEEGPYADLLTEWVTKQKDAELIRFRPYIPWDAREGEAAYQLTPQETSRLLVQTFETFARIQDDKGVDVLLDAIAHGNAKNKYALAGLLIRATM